MCVGLVLIGENLFHASGYFDQMYDYAVELIKSQKAYVCGLNERKKFESTEVPLLLQTLESVYKTVYRKSRFIPEDDANFDGSYVCAN